MFSESGYRPEEEKLTPTPKFNTETLSGLFKLRGHDLDIKVANDFRDPEIDPMVTLSNQFIINSDLPSDKAVIYFPENYMPELVANLGDKYLDILLKQLKEKKIEWGTQILPEAVTPDLAKKMKSAGCSYVDLDFPTTDKDLLKAEGRNTTPENIKTAIDILDTAGIRIGIKLVFGNSGSVKKGDLDVHVGETRHSADNSINFVRQNLEKGKNITRVNFTLSEKSDAKSTESENLVGYPWNRFQNYSTVKNPSINKELADHIINKGVHEIGEVLAGQDFYTDGEIYGQARTGKLPEYIDFNHASLTIPNLTVAQRIFIDSLPFDPRHVANLMTGRNSSLERYRKAGDPREAFDILQTKFETLVSLARAYLAIILGVKENPERIVKKFEIAKFAEDHIALAPNTTQAIEWAIGMVAIEEKLLSNSGNEKSSVVISDAEHHSIKRLLPKISDKSNKDGRESSASFQDFGRQYPFSQNNPKLSKKLHWEQREASMLSRGDGFDILDKVDANTKMVILSHVIRDTGEIIDIKKVCTAIKKRSPNCWVLVDGAQAMGALPNFSVEDLGCDFYVGTPHKTLNSYPFGVLYMNDNALELAPKMIKASYTGELPLPAPAFAFSFMTRIRAGIEHESYRKMLLRDGFISPYEPASLVSNYYPNITINPGNRYSNPAWDKLRKLGLENIPEKDLILEKLQEAQETREKLKGLAINLLTSEFGNDLIILSPQNKTHSDFILSFSFPNHDNREIVKTLWSEYKIGETFVARSNAIRISFNEFNTEQEIKSLVEALKNILPNTKKV